MALERERDRAVIQGRAQRFEKLYADTLSIIENHILPLISDEVLAKSKRNVKPHHIPLLE